MATEKKLYLHLGPINASENETHDQLKDMLEQLFQPFNPSKVEIHKYSKTGKGYWFGYVYLLEDQVRPAINKLDGNFVRNGKYTLSLREHTPRTQTQSPTAQAQPAPQAQPAAFQPQPQPAAPQPAPTQTTAQAAPAPQTQPAATVVATKPAKRVSVPKNLVFQVLDMNPDEHGRFRVMIYAQAGDKIATAQVKVITTVARVKLIDHENTATELTPSVPLTVKTSSVRKYFLVQLQLPGNLPRSKWIHRDVQLDIVLGTQIQTAHFVL